MLGHVIATGRIVGFGIVVLDYRVEKMFCFDFEHHVYYQFKLISANEIKNSGYSVKLFYFISASPFSHAKNSCVRKIRDDKILL